jgi:hypothetical protein
LVRSGDAAPVGSPHGGVKLPLHHTAPLTQDGGGASLLVVAATNAQTRNIAALIQRWFALATKNSEGEGETGMGFKRGKSLLRFWCTAFGFALFATITLGTHASATNNCLQDEYTAAGNGQTLNCTANDVRVAKVVAVKDLSGNTLTSCYQGSTFSFIADFEIVTSSTSSRSNIGLYFATQNQATALTGTCVDNIISPPHTCPGGPGSCGSDYYHELDSAPDNCGDTSSSDNSPVFGAAAQGVTIEVDNFLCQPPAGSSTLVLPNCTSWQVPGKTISCVSPASSYPYELAAIPGSPSKCNCSSIPLPISVLPVSAGVQKACTTANTPGPATFTQGANPTQSPTSCDAGPEGSTVTYTVAITNASSISGNNVVVDQICDNAYGNIFTANGFTSHTCAPGTVGTATNVSCPPAPIGPLATGTCTFTAVMGENGTVTDTVTASGHSSINTGTTFGPAQSNSVTVTSTDAPATATVTKGYVGTEAGCATVRYSVDVHNSSGYDETETLSSLTDTVYGDITKLSTGTTPPIILGTTCGVADGLGTLAGTGNGAGAFPATIAVGGDYTCQFDGQFCSAVDINACLTQVDSVSGVLKGDESSDTTFTQKANTLSVKECFTATVTSQ